MLAERATDEGEEGGDVGDERGGRGYARRWSCRCGVETAQTGVADMLRG